MDRHTHPIYGHLLARSLIPIGDETIVRELAHTDRVREATAEMVGRWGEVLDRLGDA